jgi:hypothetical protein
MVYGAMAPAVILEWGLRRIAGDVTGRTGLMASVTHVTREAAQCLIEPTHAHS